MIILKTINEVKKYVKEYRKEGLSIGFVPTMGYLHEGHESLMKKARENNDKVIVSIFVNPIQFGPNEDYETYPRDLERDSEICKAQGVDVIFNPEPSEMYPNGTPFAFVDIKELGNGLCGAKRPGHFQGVCTVVNKLFNIVTPDRAYFGEKDAQQVAIIKKMVSDLSMDVEVVPCPIIREEDGLAKSSRNTYLSEEERKAALVLSKSLNKAKEAIRSSEKEVSKLKEIIESTIKEEKLAKIDYIEVVDGETLRTIETIEGKVLTAIAVYIGKTRLIDNFFM